MQALQHDDFDTHVRINSNDHAPLSVVHRLSDFSLVLVETWLLNSRTGKPATFDLSSRSCASRAFLEHPALLRYRSLTKVITLSELNYNCPLVVLKSAVLWLRKKLN
jgi:hypothetical protein